MLSQRMSNPPPKKPSKRYRKKQAPSPLKRLVDEAINEWLKVQVKKNTMISHVLEGPSPLLRLEARSGQRER